MAIKTEQLSKYTEKQQLYLKGEISEDELHGQFFRWLLHRAKELDDKAVIEHATTILEDKRNERYEKVWQQSRERGKRIVSGEIQPLATPKTLNYTETEQKVIKGLISADSVHGKVLNSLCAKAKARGDIEIFDKFYPFHVVRSNAEHKKVINRFKRFHIKPDDASGEAIEVYESRDYLSDWEERLLCGDVLITECSTRHLEHVLAVVTKDKDEDKIKTAKMMLNLKRNPSLAFEYLVKHRKK